MIRYFMIIFIYMNIIIKSSSNLIKKFDVIIDDKKIILKQEE